MTDDLNSIPIPGPSSGQNDAMQKTSAWKTAEAEMNKIAGKNTSSTGNGYTSAGMYTGQNGSGMGMYGMPWMNQFYPQQAPPFNYGSSFEGGAGGLPWHQNNFVPQGQQKMGGLKQKQQPSNAQAYQYPQQQNNWNVKGMGWNQNNGNGRGRGRGMYNNDRGQSNWKPPGADDAGRFQPFSMNIAQKANVPHLTSSFVPQSNAQRFNPRQQGMGRGVPAAPEGAEQYMKRAYAAVKTPEERLKVQEYLDKRVRPLINAGTAANVNWDRELLPHERNFTLPEMWTPANQLPNGSYKKSKSNQNRRDVSPDRRRSDASHGDRKRSRGDSSSSGSDVIEIFSHNKSSKKAKTKAEKKAEKVQNKKEKQRKKQTQQEQPPKWKIDNDSQSKKDERARRFAGDTAQTARQQPVLFAMRSLRTVVRGTCTDIEKSYFRLTAAPDPSVVRPLHILGLSLDNVKNKYRANAEYRYLSSQLRSIRQDLTVQRIRNEFTVEVYEINARISLEKSDREEFNQCQSQLKLLYSEVDDCPNQAEFVSYRLLYYIAMENQIDINSLLMDLTPELEREECVSFALSVRTAYATGNYRRLFKLFKNAPKMCPFIMDLFVERERKRALNIIYKAYRPTIAYSKVAAWLGTTEEDLVEWLVELSVADAVVGGSLDCRINRTF